MSQEQQTITRGDIGAGIQRRIVHLGGSRVATAGFIRPNGPKAKSDTGEKYKLPVIKVNPTDDGGIKNFDIEVPFQLTQTKATQADSSVNTFLVGQSLGWKAVTIPLTDESGEEETSQSGRVKQVRLLLDLEGKGQFTHKVSYMVTVMAKPLTEEDYRRLAGEGKIEAGAAETES